MGKDFLLEKNAFSSVRFFSEAAYDRLILSNIFHNSTERDDANGSRVRQLGRFGSRRCDGKIP